MAEMVICKSCGFIMEKGKMGDRCPACGVPSKMFQPHDERISPRRKMLLSLDIHPVIVHFPQAFVSTILLLSIAGIFVHGRLQSTISATVQMLGILLPMTVAGAFASGLFDGKIRFRKVKTPLLIRKMVFGTLFFVAGCAIAGIVVRFPPGTTTHNLLVVAMALPALGCASLLGVIGTRLLNARFPG
jgi:hypothetical protein